MTASVSAYQKPRRNHVPVLSIGASCVHKLRTPGRYGSQVWDWSYPSVESAEVVIPDGKLLCASAFCPAGTGKDSTFCEGRVKSGGKSSPEPMAVGPWAAATPAHSAAVMTSPINRVELVMIESPPSPLWNSHRFATHSRHHLAKLPAKRPARPLVRFLRVVHRRGSRPQYRNNR